MGTTPEEYGFTPGEYRYYPWRIWVLPLKNIGTTPEEYRYYPWSSQPVKSMGTTPEECAYYPWRIWVYPWRTSWKLKLHPQRILYFFALPLPSTSMFITYPWRIPWFLNQGRVDIKCKIQSPKLFYSESWHSSVLLRVKTGYFPCVTLHKVPQMLELYRSCCASEKVQS